MLFKQQTNLSDSYDVVVAGGGPAGFGAGVAAARAGLKTILIEGNGCLGGTSTAGALPFILGATTGSIPFPEMVRQGLQYKNLPHPRKVVGGIYDDLIKNINAQNGGVGPAVIVQTDKYPGLDRLGCHDEFTFDIETGKRVYDEMALASGLDILYYTHALNVERSGDEITGVYVSNKSGITFIPCKAVIDCTGDADLVARAGFETTKGDHKTGEMTGVGLVAHIENIDAGAIEEYLNSGADPWFRDLCEKAAAEHPELGDDVPKFLIIFPMIQPGVFMINGGTTDTGIDGTNAADLTKLTLWGRRRARFLVEELFHKHIPGGENCSLRLTAHYPGIRETRRITGEYILTEEDLLAGAKFNDTIALAGRHFDLHRGGEQGQPFSKKRLGGGVAPIPYRSLIPKGSSNIIAAGRCISAEGQALGPARIMSTCMAIGEAAGEAAVLKLEQKVSFNNIDIEKLKSTLRKNGAEIDA